MFKFRKKSPDEDEEFEESQGGRALSRKSKKTDSGTEAPKKPRKKKKEEKKPWGKKERIVVFTVLTGTVAASAFLALSARSFKLAGLPRLKAPSVKFEKTYVLEAEQTKNAGFAQVKKDFNKITNPLTGIYGLYVLRLNANESYGINETELFQAASLIKLPVMAGLLMEVESGRLSLDDAHTLKENDKVAGSGSLSSAPEGTVVTIEELLTRMGNSSDNTAFNIAKNLLGDNKIETIISDIGMRDTSLKENKTTPADIGKFFKKLHTSRLLNQESSELLINSLTNTIYESWLVPGVPEGTQVAHKYGREANIVNDAGIVFAPEPYVIVIMSKGIVGEEADMIFPELSELIWNFERAN